MLQLISCPDRIFGNDLQPRKTSHGKSVPGAKGLLTKINQIWSHKKPESKLTIVLRFVTQSKTSMMPSDPQMKNRHPR